MKYSTYNIVFNPILKGDEAPPDDEDGQVNFGDHRPSVPELIDHMFIQDP